MSEHEMSIQGEQRASQRAFDSTSRLIAVIIGIAAVVLGIAAGLFNPFLSPATSAQGAEIDRLFSVTLGIGTAIFVIVQGFLLYSIVRFQRQPDDESDGLPIRGNTALEVLWTAIPAVIVVFLGTYSFLTLQAIDRPQPGEMVVEVKAFQFAWEFYYPDYDVTANELHIPVDRPVLLKMRSTDLIHSFWVPQFRIKKDVMPDRITEARITGTELGTYPIVCAELCGAGHAVMRSQVVVEPAPGFQNWLAGIAGARRRLAEAQATDPIAYGRQLFNQFACNACHALADANAVGQIGPKLDGIGSRAGDVVPGQPAEEYLRDAVLKPNDHIAEGYSANLMPQDYRLRMSDAEVEALVQYMLSQK